jgi:TolA-binding protein
MAPTSAPAAKKLPETNIAPVVQTRSPEASHGPVSSLQTGVNEMSQRLSQLETTVVRLERLEKVVASGGNNNQISAQQFQDLMKRVQDLGQEVKNISAKLQGLSSMTFTTASNVTNVQTKGWCQQLSSALNVGKLAGAGGCPRNNLIF